MTLKRTVQAPFCGLLQKWKGFERNFWSQNELNGHKYKESQLNDFGEDVEVEFPKHQHIKMGEKDLTQMVRLEKQSIVAAAVFLSDMKLTPSLTSTLGRELDEQLKRFEKAIALLDRPDGNDIAATKKNYVNKPGMYACTDDTPLYRIKRKNFNSLCL